VKRACLLIAIVFAACACGSQKRSAPPHAKLPQPFADHLLGLLPAPDLLQRETIAAINADQVHPSLQEELLGQVNALRASAAASRRQSLEQWLRRHGAGPRKDLRARRGVSPDDLYLRLVDAEPESFDGQWAFLAQMTPGQRALFTLHVADDEINNGGLSQLFANDTPAFAAEAAAGARLVGAHEFADVLARAVALFPAARPLPRNRRYTEPGEQELGRLEDRWYALEERRLPGDYIRRYVERHPDEFYR
jgi:hypothetical protein